jgi:hypothetical protein
LKNSILYYPTITIPPGSWLRQALLYWDDVASIVPRRWDEKELIPYTPEVEYLIDQGEFRPVRPENLIYQGFENVMDLSSEFETLFNSPSFQNLIPPKGERVCNSRIHEDKISHFLVDFLIEEQAAENDYSSDWILFEENTALLYMSLLAKYLATIDSNYTISGTDRIEYENLIFKPDQSDHSTPCANARFMEMLPVPTSNVPFSDIISFKRNRKDELLKFRIEVREFQNEISNVVEPKELNEVLNRYKERIEVELHSLTRALNDAKLETIAGTFKTLVNLKSPALWATVGVASGHLDKISEVPIEWALSGAGLLGAIEIGSYLVNRRSLKHSSIQDSSFSYLYHAKKEGLVR